MLSIENWPILVVSQRFEEQTDPGMRLREITQRLEKEWDLPVLRSWSYEDAQEIFSSRSDLSCVLVDWDVARENTLEQMGMTRPSSLVRYIHKRNAHLPILLLTDDMRLKDLPMHILPMIQDCIWLNGDTVDFLLGRIATRATSYLDTVAPSFFGKLMQYTQKYKYAWHTPGHMGGTGFLRSPAGTALFQFYGENTLRSDLSISVSDLGSLLDHSGYVGGAERNSAKVFGADQTYYVLNGTSTVNQIIWDSQLTEGDLALVDRNCHKSLNYAMVHTKAYPIYLMPRRNYLGIIGPVPLAEFSEETLQEKAKQNSLIPDEHKGDPVRMMALTNSTYDGLCYCVSKIKQELSPTVERLHFDEAWYAYAHFHPLYRGFYGMTPEDIGPNDPPVFCGQSTHKLLTAFSQASMVHIRDGGKIKIDPKLFNEAYMMHGSTSPQYSMIASLDVATKMMEDNGPVILNDILYGAIELRKKIASTAVKMADNQDWFFTMWQPEQVEVNGQKQPFYQVSTKFLSENQEPWILSQDNNWHHFDDIEDHYVMLDPIKLTICTPGVNQDGTMSDFGIPACVVANYLANFNIVCEKNDYYSFLLLNSLGTDQSKQGALLTGLCRFKEDYDSNRPMAEVFPDLAASYPQAYGEIGLQDHCRKMHAFLSEHDVLARMHEAYQVLPNQSMRPSDAYQALVKGKAVQTPISDVMGKTQSVMLVPYPPGIPILMGGETWDDKAKAVQKYLLLRQEFENQFPGYDSDIHGIERTMQDGVTTFTTLAF